MLWIDSVRSTAYHAANTAASTTAKTAVLAYRLMPSLSVRKSVIWVPTTLTSTTVSQ